ncbi:hypothetical protein K435DRAFT_636238, partial [Dendrothele bispora CBS 962.96]
LVHQVVDHHPAQRKAYVSAFEDFWIQRDDNERSREELKAAAMALLRGCEQHFRESTTRIAHITSIIPPEAASRFKKICRNLCEVEGEKEFQSLVALIQNEWPDTKAWLDWWLQKEHACMIFKSQMTMEPENRDHIPSTTNAEESMHSKIYLIA